MDAPRRLTHAQACAELRKAARLLGEGKITRHAWFESVQRIIAARVQE
jgi:hypothetical protein